MTTDNQAIGSPGGLCHNSPLAKVKRLGVQYRMEQDGRVKQQLLLRMRETLLFMPLDERQRIIIRECTGPAPFDLPPLVPDYEI